jgi:hypothetical protein
MEDKYRGEYHRNATRRIWKQKVAFCRAYKASIGCSNCGEKDPIVLDFHHREKEQKSKRLKGKFGFKRSFPAFGWKALTEEIEKCDILCANCHRRHTHLERTMEN